MSECELIKRAEREAVSLVNKLKELSAPIALAESCTAGLISGLLANVPGSSKVLWGSFVCYAKEAKVRMLDLDENMLASYGLVSRETACAMAQGALQKSGAVIAASVTGLAGPGGDGSCTPVGTVWAAVAGKETETAVMEFHFSGSRNEIRLSAAIAAMEMVDRSVKALDIN